MKLKKGDNVVVIAGKDKGKTGIIIKTLRDTNQVLVEGVNMKKKHVKSRGEHEGGIVEMMHPIDASNVAYVDPKTGKATRIGYTVKGDKKVRITKASGSELS